MALKQRHASPCDNKCGARSKLHRVKFRGHTLDLCRQCLIALRNVKEQTEPLDPVIAAERAEAVKQTVEQRAADLVAFPQGIEYNPPR